MGATTPSLVPPTCTPLVPLCTDVRSARLRSPSPWSPATHTPLTSVVSSATSPPLLPPSLLTPTVPLCLQSPLTLLRLVPLTSPLLPRPEGRSVKLRCLSTSSPALPPPLTSTPSSATTWLLLPSPPPSPPTPTEPSSPRSPPMLPRLVLPTSRLWPPPASRERAI